MYLKYLLSYNNEKYVLFVIIRLLTPIANDHWGWSQQDAILYLGITMAAGGVLAGFCFSSVGPLCKRFDERLVLIFCGIFPMIIGRLMMMPMGKDNPPFVGNVTDCPGHENDNSMKLKNIF